MYTTSFAPSVWTFLLRMRPLCSESMLSYFAYYLARKATRASVHPALASVIFAST